MDHSRTAQRQRRLHRGLRLWQRDLELTKTYVDRVCFLTLTFRSDNQADAVGALTAFWHNVRAYCGPPIYFALLELQARGQVHYHVWWINPPPRRDMNLTVRLAKWWPHGFAKQRWWQASDWRRQGMSYITNYCKKRGPKRHQQQYEDLEVPLRTFSTQVRAFRTAELLDHEDDQVAAYIFERWTGTEYIPAHIQIVAEGRHVPQWTTGGKSGLPGSRPPPIKGRGGRQWCELYGTRSYRARARRWRQKQAGKRADRGHHMAVHA